MQNKAAGKEPHSLRQTKSTTQKHKLFVKTTHICMLAEYVCVGFSSALSNGLDVPGIQVHQALAARRQRGSVSVFKTPAFHKYIWPVIKDGGCGTSM